MSLERSQKRSCWLPYDCSPFNSTPLNSTPNTRTALNNMPPGEPSGGAPAMASASASGTSVRPISSAYTLPWRNNPSQNPAQYAPITDVDMTGPMTRQIRPALANSMIATKSPTVLPAAATANIIKYVPDRRRPYGPISPRSPLWGLDLSVAGHRSHDHPAQLYVNL